MRPPSPVLKHKAAADEVTDDEDDDVETEEEEEELGTGSGSGFEESCDKKKQLAVSISLGGGVLPPCCQVEKCGVDLTHVKVYHRRHRVCEHHSKSPVAVVDGLEQRFCQQCSRFHDLPEFDGTKRSCRRRLAGHNERRRRSSSESNGRASGYRGLQPRSKAIPFQQVDETGSFTHNHFHIR
ncbi:hypothetical protein RJ639_033363 [Escallonia herrerae]|uniref:SBP-type domain-containing protein n=1 Tax=Escallonia herrerae TaxID=1293975 RepID=A0AA88XAM1_9ASTE|nr:hypothetical protein RJ639_033363 [Escallonia herrerae]